MRDSTFEIEFVSHCLAGGIGPDGTRDRFQRTSDNRIVAQPSWWHAALTRAITLSHLTDVRAIDITVEPTFEAPTELWDFHFAPKQSRCHEAIMPGTRVRFCAIVADHVTEQTLTTILDRMGRFVGLSPFGYRMGFGKFVLRSVQIK